MIIYNSIAGRCKNTSLNSLAQRDISCNASIGDREDGDGNDGTEKTMAKGK
jgi:hypothetical protein